MSIMAEKNVYEYTTSEDRDTNDTMSLEVYESSGQFIYMPKIESYNEETMMDVSEDPSDEKHGILDDEQRIVEPNYHSLDAQTSVYYDEPPDTCQEIEIDYKPCVSSPTLLSDWKTHDDEWEENNQDDEWEENNQEDRSATDEGASFEENQIVGSCNNDADEDENVDDSDEETIATFLTTAGQRLALYAVEDSDQVFAVAVYDESGEPPTNFQFLVKSDVERLIGEGAVRTVKKPTQINKQLLTEETTSFSHDMEEQEEQDYQEDQPSPPPPPLDDYELDDLKNQQQYDIERTMKETIDTSCMKMLVEPEKEETSSHMPNEPANFVSVDMEKVTSPTPETSEIHDHVDRNETYEEIDSLNNDEIIVERSTVDNLFMENESANDELTFADIEETLGTLRTYERKFLSFNKFAKKEKEEKIIEEEEEEESPASDWADASIETDVPMPLVNDTTVIDNRVEKIIPRNKITEKITIITVNTPIQTPRGTNLVRKFPSSLLCRRNVNSKQLQQQKQPQQQQKQPQQLQKQPQQLQKLPQQQPQQQQKQPQQLQKQPQQLQKLPQPGQQRKPAVIVKGTSLLIGNNNRLPKTPTIEPPLVERPTEIITMSPKAKRPRKQQLTTLNRGDSEIIIQPATFTDPEEETTSKKRKGRRKRKPVHTQRYKMKATVAKRMAKKRGRRENEAKKQYEIIEIDVDDDDDDEEEKNRRDKERRRVVGKKKNIVEITIHDESKEKGSSDKENQVIMVGDSDDEEEAKIAGNLKNSSSLADADSPPVASSVTALICQHCSRKFRQKRAMKTHSRVCPKSPKNVRRLEERITRSTDSTTGKKQFPCKICNEKFDVVVVLARHVRSMHSMRKKVNSTDVNNAAAENSTLTSMKTRKERVKDNDESEKIDQTGEDVETIKSAAKTTETATTTTTTATVGRRKRRRRRNNKNRTGWKGQKLNCSDCAKWFSSAALLASHSLQHATKKSEKQIRRCQTCKKIIKSRLLYIRHMRMHSRVKKLQKKLHHTRQSATGNVKLATLRKRGRPRKL